MYNISEPIDDTSNCAAGAELGVHNLGLPSLVLPGNDQYGSEPVRNTEDIHTITSGKTRLSRNGARASLPAASVRRSRLQELGENGNISPRDAPERASLTPAMRKRYLKDLLMNNPSHSGLSNVLSSPSVSPGGQDTPPTPDYSSTAGWALYPVEHAWMMSAVDGNYETIIDFISEDPYLLTKKDFVSGFTVLHWLAKRGEDDILLKLLKYAEKEGIPVNINVKGSACLTPLHVAAMHSQYAVVKILVGAFSANVDAMDHNGRRAWQYLKDNAPVEIKELLGTWDDDHSVVGAQNTNNSATQCQIDEEEKQDEVDSFSRTRRAGSLRFRSFKKMFNPLSSYFGSKI